MIAPPYRTQIDHVVAGEPGKASVPGRPDRQLEGNLQYLKELVESALLGQALFYRDVTVAASVLEGQPVYYNSDTQQFEQALAGVESVISSGTLAALPSSDVVGIVYTKTTSTKADLLVMGVAELDLANAVAGSLEDGRYYLSASQPGILVKQRPPATVAVLHHFNGTVLVVPDTKDFLEDHIHFTFDLVALPAGTTTPPAPGGDHELDTVDPSAPGWLPAGHSSFEGNAPTGALFGYNLAAHPELNQVWPPIPVAAAKLEIYRPSTEIGRYGLVGAPADLVIMDRYGIWWMSNCYDEAPWPVDATGSSEAIDEGSASLTCPIPAEMQLVLSFIRMTFLTDKTVVTSLESESPFFEFVDCDGNAGRTGDLKLRSLFEFLVTDADELGSVVFKSFDEATMKFQTGRVLEGVIAGDNVTLSSTHQRLLDPEDSGSAVVHQGTVQVDVDTDPLGKELPVEMFRLDDARLRFIGPMSYLALLDAQASGFIGKVKIPPAGLPADPHVKIRTVFYGDAAGTPPAVTLAQTLVSRPVGTPALPAVTAAVVFDVPAIGAIAADDYFEVESDAIAVVAGDTLFFDMSRAGSDGYSGELGVLRVGAVIQSGA